MINIKINSKPTAIGKIWYHYKNVENSNSEYYYTLDIPRSGSEFILLIEKYSGCSIMDSGLTKIVIEKDKQKRSMGLLWNILEIAKEKYLSNDSFNWEWVLNNITDIKVNDSVISITGNVTPAATSHDLYTIKRPGIR